MRPGTALPPGPPRAGGRAVRQVDLLEAVPYVRAQLDAEVPPAMAVDDEGHVRGRGGPPRLDARAQPVHGVAEPLEDGGEEATLFVAVATPPPTDELRAHDVE